MYIKHCIVFINERAELVSELGFVGLRVLGLLEYAVQVLLVGPLLVLVGARIAYRHEGDGSPLYDQASSADALHDFSDCDRTAMFVAMYSTEYEHFRPVFRAVECKTLDSITLRHSI